MLCLLCMLFASTQEASCQGRELKAKGTYTYVLPTTESEAYGVEVAIHRAKLNAIEDNFGTIISQQNITEISNQNANSNISFTSRGMSEVKGEWIQNLSKPHVEIERNGSTTLIKCTVYGLIREIVQAEVEFEAALLCNGTTARFKRSDFQNNDDLYLSFQSAQDGYLAVYLRDEKRNAFRLLPYPKADGGPQQVTGGEKYVFFSHDKAPSHLQGVTTAYHLTAESTVEHNYVYIIFSPTPFNLAVDTYDNSSSLRQLPFGEYENWIGKLRRKNPQIQILEIPITIRQ